jgi:hypothetical protein
MLLSRQDERDPLYLPMGPMSLLYALNFKGRVSIPGGTAALPEMGAITVIAIKGAGLRLIDGD